MLRSRTWRWAGAFLPGLLALALCAPALAELERADPLEVPSEPVTDPARVRELAPTERLDVAVASYRDHGYEELPYVAWGLVRLAAELGDPQLAERALEIAPGVPAIWFRAALATRNPVHALRAAESFSASLPAALWALSTVGGVLGAGLLAAASALLVLAMVRGAPLHAFSWARRFSPDAPLVWPGVLLAITALCLLTLGGIGWLAVLCTGGALASTRLRRGETLGVAAVVGVVALVVGPGLDLWARVATHLEHDAVLTAAWRVERGHDLPGDAALVEAARLARPSDALLAVAAATHLRRGGQVDEALAILPDPAGVAQPRLQLAVLNLRATLQLAGGDVVAAIDDLERARSADESARLLFNLSQAYGRALRLMDNKAAFNAARELDPVLVSDFEQGQTLHRFLMSYPIPMHTFLQRALLATAESAAYAREMRARLLGRALPDFAWLVLPVLSVAILLLRRSTVQRCSRCDRLMAARGRRRGAPVTTCVRCERLFERKDSIDARVRKRQLDLDRQQQRANALRVAALGAFVPGVIAVHEGQIVRGVVQIGLAATGVALLLIARTAAAPWEVGAIAIWGMTFAGLALAVPTWVSALLRALRLATRSRRNTA